MTDDAFAVKGEQADVVGFVDTGSPRGHSVGVRCAIEEPQEARAIRQLGEKVAETLLVAGVDWAQSDDAAVAERDDLALLFMGRPWAGTSGRVVGVTSGDYLSEHVVLLPAL
jgi:hypothetical protein